VPAGRERGLGAAGDRGDGLAAVGLVADDHDDLAAAGCRLADVGRSRARCEPLVDVGASEVERRRGLARSQQGARDDGVGLNAQLAQLPAQCSCLLAARRGERPQLVGVSRRRFGVANDHELHRGQDNRVMARLGGPAGALAAFALTAGLAFDGGGFRPVAVDRALVGVATLALLVVVLVRGERPGRLAGALLAALGLLAAWTAASWLWSDSPPVALQEAQRGALYLAVAVAVVLAGRRVALPWICRGVAAGATVAALWNLAIRLAPDWLGRSALRADIGQLADPVGYANSLALLAAVGLLLALGIDGAAAVAMVPLAAVIALQQSTGTEVALAAGLVVYALFAARPLRVLALLVLPAVGGLLVALSGGVVDPSPTDLLAAAHQGHRLLLVLACLAAAQAVLALGRFSPPAGRRVPTRLAAFGAIAVVVCVFVAMPFALRGNERGRYWGVALHEARANPVLGSGAGTFVDWWLRNRPVPLSTLEAHSLYLETLAELGPAGLAVLLVGLWIPLAAAWRLRDDPCGPPLLGVFVAFDVAAAVDFHWELAAVTAPVVALAAAAAVHADRREGLVRARVVVPALAALTVASVLALAGNAAIEAGNGAQATRLAPYSAQAWKLLGDVRRTNGDRPGAVAAYRHATRLDPNDWSTWAALASVERGEPRRSASAEAARLNPLGGVR
jgi:hypothetical protein